RLSRACPGRALAACASCSTTPRWTWRPTTRPTRGVMRRWTDGRAHPRHPSAPGLSRGCHRGPRAPLVVRLHRRGAGLLPVALVAPGAREPGRSAAVRRAVPRRGARRDHRRRPGRLGGALMEPRLSPSPAPSAVCQRWQDRRHHWVPASAGRFDPLAYEVAPVAERDARALVPRPRSPPPAAAAAPAAAGPPPPSPPPPHSAASYPASRLRYGLHARGGELVGV